MGQPTAPTVGTSRRRAGRHVRRGLHREARQRLWRNKHILLGVVALYFLGGVIVVGTSMLSSGASWQVPFALGLFVGFLPALWLTFSSAMGIAPRLLGADAERWTADELRKLPTPSWAVYHDVVLDQVNVDHVAIGPGRVYAIETKWTGSELPKGQVKRLAGQAAHRAQALQRALAGQNVNRGVVPLLVLWGTHAHKRFADPAKVGRTRVMAGHESKVWLRRMKDAGTSDAIDHPARQAVRRLIADTEAG